MLHYLYFGVMYEAKNKKTNNETKNYKQLCMLHNNFKYS